MVSSRTIKMWFRFHCLMKFLIWKNIYIYILLFHICSLCHFFFYRWMKIRLLCLILDVKAIKNSLWSCGLMLMATLSKMWKMLITDVCSLLSPLNNEFFLPFFLSFFYFTGSVVIMGNYFFSFFLFYFIIAAVMVNLLILINLWFLMQKF